ncbi:hypothetical protein J6590_093921 [Homalodisca vitripennis]|nr:hypothetical protein J6590_093921 [Homalodisca vitripennis]
MYYTVSASNTQLRRRVATVQRAAMTVNSEPRISLGTSDNSVTTMAACVQYELLTVLTVCESDHRAVGIAILGTASNDN